MRLRARVARGARLQLGSIDGLEREARVASEEGGDPCVALPKQRRAHGVGKAAAHAQVAGRRVEQPILQPVQAGQPLPIRLCAVLGVAA